MKQKTKLSSRYFLSYAALIIASSLVTLSLVHFMGWTEQRITTHMISRMLVGVIIMIVSFISLRTAEKEKNKGNFCSNCDTPIRSEAIFCTHCGKQH